MTAPRVTLFNSSIELGLRALCVLVETHPRPADLQRLVLFDYLLVHSADVDGGPESIHPPLPQRGSEVLVRRAILESGLALYARRGLVAVIADTSGFTYMASDRGASFLNTLRANYVDMLRDRARWIADSFEEMQTHEIQGFVNTELDQWGGQFADRATGRGSE